MHTILTVVIDPNMVFRAGLISLIGHGDIEIVGNGAQLSDVATVSADRAEVRLVLCDLEVGLDIKETMAGLRALFPNARIVTLARSLNLCLIVSLIEVGVDGCLAKNISPDALKHWLHLVMVGEKVFPLPLAAIQIGSQLPDNSSVHPVQHRALSQRETEILHHLVNGDTNKMIARRIGMTELAVKVHLKNIQCKIGACNRTQVAIWAFNNGFSAAVVHGGLGGQRSVLVS